jgi:aspyridone synthetase trans-acting enoyl reductase
LHIGEFPPGNPPIAEFKPNLFEPAYPASFQAYNRFSAKCLSCNCSVLDITNTTMRALTGGHCGEYSLTDGLEIPKPKRGTMLCQVYAVALNPSDAKMADFAMTEGAIGGADFAGVVIEVGQEVTRFAAGDRVFALAFGLNPADNHTGAFAEYALATEDLAGKIPPGMTFQQACTMGVAVGTAGMAVFQELRLPLPGTLDAKNVKPLPVLVSGGATSTGTMAIQLLKW